MTDLQAKREHTGLEIEPVNLDYARLRSTWPVSSFRYSSYLGTKLLGEALQEGVEVKRDPKRTGFFEADIGHAWVYFHVARQFRRIYLIAFIR